MTMPMTEKIAMVYLKCRIQGCGWKSRSIKLGRENGSQQLDYERHYVTTHMPRAQRVNFEMDEDA